MKVTENVVVKKEIEVVACIECGHDNILISDNNYSSFNTGGGKCKNCGHEVSSGVGCNPTMSQLVSIWNEGNDIDLLIKKQEVVISTAQKEIDKLKNLKIQRTKN